ncbi:MAG: 4-hydroxy-tetrahydrodipicolinate synthase [Bacteroidales bacterium]
MHKLQNRITGVGVAIVTPFRKDMSIDFLSLEKLLKHTIDNGVDYIVALGTTGESVTLNKEEKQAVLNFVIEYTDKKVPVVAGFGGNNTHEIVNSIKNYDFTGIDGILSVTPYYNKPSQRGLYEHYQAISKTAPVPVILYNVPGRTGVNMTAETVIQIANDFKNIIAVKEASGNFEQIMTIVKNKPSDFKVISGDDMITLPLISVGVEGVISVVANAFPKEFSELVHLALKGKFKEAWVIQQKLLEIMNTLFVDGNPAGVKAALKIFGITQDYLRLPLVPVTKNTLVRLTKQIEDLK